MNFIIDFFRFFGFEKIDPIKELDFKLNIEMIEELNKYSDTLYKIILDYERDCERLIKMVEGRDEIITFLEWKIKRGGIEIS